MKIKLINLDIWFLLSKQSEILNITHADIRAGMAMLLASLGAEGQSTIHNIGQIDRGYERIDERLRALGATIERIDD